MNFKKVHRYYDADIHEIVINLNAIIHMEEVEHDEESNATQRKIKTSIRFSDGSGAYVLESIDELMG